LFFSLWAIVCVFLWGAGSWVTVTGCLGSLVSYAMRFATIINLI